MTPAARFGAAAVLLVVLAGVALWGFTRNAPAPPTPSASPSVAAPDPSGAPATSSEAAAPPMLPANDVDDPVEALRAIWDFYDWLLEHPDPDLLSLIYHEGCDCYGEVAALLNSLIEDGSHIVVETSSIENLSTVSDFDEVVEVTYVRAMRTQLVSRDGVATDLGEVADPHHVVLRRTAGRWLIREIF